MKFLVVNLVPSPKVTKKWLGARAGQIWRALKAKGDKAKGGKIEDGKIEGNWEFVTLVFVSKREMQKLNYDFRGKDYPTDVLSFAPSEEGGLGELVFCPDVLLKQAKEHGLTYQLELTYMLIHGFLHLLGHDHERSASAAKKMFKIQDDIFARYLPKAKRVVKVYSVKITTTKNRKATSK